MWMSRKKTAVMVLIILINLYFSKIMIKILLSISRLLHLAWVRCKVVIFTQMGEDLDHLSRRLVMVTDKGQLIQWLLARKIVLSLLKICPKSNWTNIALKIRMPKKKRIWLRTWINYQVSNSMNKSKLKIELVEDLALIPCLINKWVSSKQIVILALQPIISNLQQLYLKFTVPRELIHPREV